MADEQLYLGFDSMFYGDHRRQGATDHDRRHEPEETMNAGTPHTASVADAEPKTARGDAKLIKRAVVRWVLAEQSPTALALDVPTRMSKFKADIAAFRSRSVHNSRDEGPTRILRPAVTFLVQCFTEREECWNECTRSEEILPVLEERKREREDLEKSIRGEEPELRDPNTLFEEYAVWHYENSRNPAYQRVQREIEQLEHALLAGTRFEQVRSADVADYLYLAVPAGAVRKEELADGWGLLWVDADLNATVAKEAERRDCLDANRLHLVQNVAAAATKDVMFKNGIRTDKEGKPFLVQPPRGHRKPGEFRLEI